MHAGAGHLPHRIEPRHRGGGQGVGAHAPHAVVGRRRHRDRGAGGVEPQIPATPKDRGELALQPFAPHGSQVEPEVGLLLLPHALHQGTAHRVPRGQISPLEVAHGAVAVAVQQPRPLAAHGFRNEEVGGPRQHQGRGVKLHEFQVADGGPGPPGHGDAIAAGLGGVGGVGKQVAAAPGGQHHRPGRQPAQGAVVQHLQAAAAASSHPQLQGQGPLQPQQPGPLQHTPLQGIHQGAAGAVLGVQHAPVAVGRLQGGAQGLALAVEIHAQLQQPLHAGRCLPHQQLHRWRVAQASAGAQGVVNVAGEAVVGPGHRGDAPLGPAAGGSRRDLLAQQQHPQLRRQLEGRHQAGGAAADNNHIPAGGELRHRASGLVGNKKAVGGARRLAPVAESRPRAGCDQGCRTAQRYWPSLMRSKPSLRAMEAGVTVKLPLYFSTSSFWRGVRSRLNRSSTLV